MSRFLSLIFMSFILISISFNPVWGSSRVATFEIPLPDEEVQDKRYSDVYGSKSDKIKPLFCMDHSLDIILSSPINTFQMKFAFTPDHQKDYKHLHKKCTGRSCIQESRVPSASNLIDFIFFNIFGPNLMKGTDLVFEPRAAEKASYLRALGSSAHEAACNPHLAEIQKNFGHFQTEELKRERSVIFNQAKFYKLIRSNTRNGSFIVHMNGIGNLEVSFLNKVHKTEKKRVLQEEETQKPNKKAKIDKEEITPKLEEEEEQGVQKMDLGKEELAFPLDEFPDDFEDFRDLLATLFMEGINQRLEALALKEHHSGSHHTHF